MKNQKNIKTYSELKKLKTHEERLNYLRIEQNVGQETFGFNRYLNQKYYKSKEWEDIRNAVIIRDSACDLGMEGRDITSSVIVHHMNPVEVKDFEEQTEYLKNPEYLISTSFNTHNEIHYGRKNGDVTKNMVSIRAKYDQCPWKK